MKKGIFVIMLIMFCKQLEAQTTIVDSFVHGGLMRTYRLYIPAIYNANNAVPVVLNLHGYTSNGLQQELYADFRPIADTANFIIAHPDGTFDATNNRFWNVFGLSPVDDNGFLTALLDTIATHYTVNPNKVYATGMSNGGYMSHQLACNVSNRITAIASVTGTMTMAMKLTCMPAHPTPMMEIHGTADGVVPYGGAGVNLPIDTVVAYWVAVNQCNQVPSINAVPDVVVNDGCTATHSVYSGGMKGAGVEFYKINGGGHTWPGAPINVGVTNMDFSASKEIWRFFSQYTLSNLTTGSMEQMVSNSPFFEIYPNPAVKNINIRFANQQSKLVSIYNTIGEKIYSNQTNDGLLNIPFNSSGIYFLQVRDHQQFYTKKIVIE
ncbi:MAG: T9SS type A sorting domain-containing protein [Bacteroidetes bacterium]|nr:T9SS type A sorting domain-containing protein [Bacteroidota bacterium]HQW45888.1 T9SS type A sorting domain-containing protein [Chitinophagaceae bacterium]